LSCLDATWESRVEPNDVKKEPLGQVKKINVYRPDFYKKENGRAHFFAIFLLFIISN
jgi:hypothetical protein